MKKRLLLTLIIAMMFFSGCFSDPELDFEDVSFLEIMTDRSRVTVQDSSLVERLTQDVYSLAFERAPEPAGGYLYDVYYTVTWYNSDGVAIECIDIVDENGYQIAHDGVVYAVAADLCVDVEFIKELSAGE